MEPLSVYPKLIKGPLPNPGVGFMTFQRFNGDKLNDLGLNNQGWMEGFPIEYNVGK